MIVYREQCRPAEPGELLRRLSRQVERLPAHPDHDAIVGLLVDLGAIESGIADALAGAEDDDGIVTRCLRRASLAAGHLLVASWRNHGAPRQRWRIELDSRLRACTGVPLPPRIDLKVAEGFAHYGHFPECHLVAAQRFAAEQEPAATICIGVRSIGTALSAVVAATLEEAGCAVSSYTLRPRGHPFDRRPVLSARLSEVFARSPGSYFLLVDEGPGISGSSLSGIAAVLSGLGIPDERIVLFPSWDPDPARLRAVTARAHWPRHRRYVSDFAEVWLRSGRLADATGLESLRDVSAGVWREELITDRKRWPAVHPQHERRKLRGGHSMIRFVGLGRVGAEKLVRAQRLGDAGFSARPSGLSHGFLAQEWVSGTPLGRGQMDYQLLERIARYLAFLRRSFPAPTGARTDLTEMMAANLEGHPMASQLSRLDGPGAEPPVAVDGRMMPHEWLRTPRGYLKVDALDHHDDHFFPGPVDVAWDVAGAAVEFGMGPEARRMLAERYRRLSGDRTIVQRLPYYTAAYLACRIGYTTLARETLGESPDGQRFERLRRRYRAQLRAQLTVPAGRSWSA